MNKMSDLVEYWSLKNTVLQWLETMRYGKFNFRMNSGADYSLYTSCFALYIQDLFGEAVSSSGESLKEWADYINIHQDEATGFYLPEKYTGDLNSKPVHQLTSFCLNALNILGCQPKYGLAFVEQWKTQKDLYQYLLDKGCFDGRPGSGNMAMFVAIFLTQQWVFEKEAVLLERMDDWFLFHEETQNRSTGFWGTTKAKQYYSGFQNAFHQFEIYHYWNRPIPFAKIIVDIVLSLQDHDGHFAATPGGGGCFDYDAAAILVQCGIKQGYRKEDVKAALTKLMKAVFRNQNKDGGFCESKKRPESVFGVLNPGTIQFLGSGCAPFPTYFKFRKTLSNSRKECAIIHTHWTKKGRAWDQSDLWNTWFRCLTIAIIDTVLGSNRSETEWNFQKSIGLGYCSIPKVRT